MSWYLDAGLAGAAFGLVAGAFTPEMIRPLPEPEHDPEEAAAFKEEEPKELYADIAALPGLRWKAALASAVIAGLVAARLDFTWELLAVIGIVPVGVALFVIDVRTRYLPTWLMAPFYGVVVLVAGLAALQRGEWDPLVAMLVGWVVYGGFFMLMWLLVPAGGLGYGDVRLAGLLGLALGLISWGAFVLGMFSGILLGGVFALVLLLARRKSHYPYGPYLLVGAVIGALYGPAFAQWYWPTA
ncbi:MAG TPA: A24 family peptidase [Nocardioidaceae bacterium]|nr:A24 family peptidase [Nocardioidaceae bacterium]